MNLLTIFGAFILCFGYAKAKNEIQPTDKGGVKDKPRDGTPPKQSKGVPPLELQSKEFAKFDHKLLSILSRQNQNKNIIVSPASLKSLLALLVEGSSNDTTNEILRALNLQPANRQNSVRVLQALQSVLKNDRSNITLKSQNRIYRAEDVSLKQNYENTMRTAYGTAVETLDFSNADHATEVINRWVNDVTKGLIRSLVEKDMIDVNTKLFLLNYIYLKAPWDMSFNQFVTRKSCFHLSDGNCLQVKFMFAKRALLYTNSDKLKAEIFEINFKDPRYRMVFLLPRKNSNVSDVLTALEGNDLLESINELEENIINLHLPRTVVEFSNSMIETLNQVGIKSVFGPNANLDNMVKGEQKLAVGNIIHKARIEMNEEGAEAAGASGGGIQLLSLDGSKYVVVDRPFLFFIRDIKVTGYLFEGIVFSPDQAQ